MTDGPTARREPTARSTEGGVEKSVANKTKHGETQSERKRGRGRPKGSKNKPKALITKEVASELLGVVKQTLPPELYQEMKDAVRTGKNISTLNEAKILMKLMGPPIWQRLIEEANAKPQAPRDFDPDLEDELGGEEEAPVGTPFNKDLNERIKVYTSLMQFVNKMERDEDESDNSEKPILEIFARRGADGGRVKVLAGYESGDMGGIPDGTGRSAIGAGTVPSEVPERQVNVSDSEQVASVRVLDPDSTGDNAQSGDES